MQKSPAYLSAKNHISGNLQEKVKIICIILGCDEATNGNDQSQISVFLIPPAASAGHCVDFWYPLVASAGALCTATGWILMSNWIIGNGKLA